MNKSAVIHARIEVEVKEGAESVFSQLGLTPTQAVRLFYKQVTLHQGLPFPIKIPNKLTRKTLDNSRKGKDVEAFDSPEDMFKNWEL